MLHCRFECALVHQVFEWLKAVNYFAHLRLAQNVERKVGRVTRSKVGFFNLLFWNEFPRQPLAFARFRELRQFSLSSLLRLFGRFFSTIALQLRQNNISGALLDSER